MSEIEEIIEEEIIDEDAPIILRINHSGVAAEFEGKNGRKIYKNIALEALSKVLNQDTEFDTGFLPLFGRNYMGIKKYIKAGDKEIIFIEASPANRLVKYGNDGEEIPNVRFPGLLMAAICRGKKNGDIEVTSTRLYATRGPILRDSDSLYRFPFGNVYSDGRICWGSVSKKNIRTVAQAGSLLDLFLSGIMNNDLAARGLKGRLKDLQDVSEYNYDSLTSENLTFKGLTSLLLSKNAG